MKLQLKQLTLPLVLLGIIGVVAFDYLSDGCIASMGGETICDAEALQDVLDLVGVIVISFFVAALQYYWKNRNVKTLE